MERFCLDSMLCTCLFRTGLGCQGLGLGTLLGFGRRGMGKRWRRTVWRVRQAWLEDSITHSTVGVDMRKADSRV